MNDTTQKSANQLYKESGSQLSFREWIEREKAKGSQIPNVAANAEMESMIRAEQQTTKKEPDNKQIILRNVAAASILAILTFFVVGSIINKKNE
jgi:hypothetical protein